MTSFPFETDELDVPFVAAAIVVPGPGGEKEVLCTLGREDIARELAAGQLLLLDDVIDLRHPAPRGARLIVRRRQAAAVGTVLIVDDDAGTRAMFEATLADIVQRCYVASDAEEAIAIVAEINPDLVLSDVRLPDVNGFELAAHLASIDFPGQTVLMSVDPGLGDASRLESVGAAGFITNPIHPAELAREVTRLIGQPTLRDVPMRAVEEPPPVDEAERISLTLLGPISVTVDGINHVLPKGNGASILAALAASAPAPLSTSQLGRLIWGQGFTSNAVYTAISRLRDQLDAVGAGDLLVSGTHGYSLGVGPMGIDAVRFESLARRALSSGNRSPEVLEAALDVWAGSPLTGVRSDSLQRWARRLEENHSQLRELLAEAWLERGDFERAIDVSRDLLEASPWRETVWAVLAVALYRAGQTRAAMATLDEASTRLREELGLDLGPELRNLEYLMLTHDPELQTWTPRSRPGTRQRPAEAH